MIARSLKILALLVATLLPLRSSQGATPRPWTSARSWLYQLQRVSMPSLAKSDYDLFVIDAFCHDSTRRPWTRAEIDSLKNAGGRRRLVVAYLSIGEAEPYRFYWRPGWKPGSPEWLDRPNPDWPDNYRVKYWNPQWRSILYGGDESYVDRIMDAGFDGVYLDIVDGYERYAKKRPTAKKEMLDLIAAIARHCRVTRGDADFGIIPQNAVELLEIPSHAALITGIGKEETYFCATNEATDTEDREWEEELLGGLVSRGKLVLCVDYVNEPAGITFTKQRCKKLGFLSLCTHVDLDRDPARP